MATAPSAPSVPVNDAAAAPETMKVTVAARDLAESRALPQMPWPEVQPLAAATPAPTRSPPAAARWRV